MRKNPALLLSLFGSLMGGLTNFLPTVSRSDPFGPGGKIPRSSTPSYLPFFAAEPDWVQARFKTPVPPSTPTRQSKRHAERMAHKAATRQPQKHRETFGKVGRPRKRQRNLGMDHRKRPHDWSGAGWQ